MTADETVILYRPVGQQEPDLIRASGWRRFPPRLHWQPIFYPVLTEDYAVKIARDWNTQDANSDYVGYVLRFNVSKPYLEPFEPHAVGGRELQEYWIPAEKLDEFNARSSARLKFCTSFEESGERSSHDV
jgi:hypothetical protein